MANDSIRSLGRGTRPSQDMAEGWSVTRGDLERAVVKAAVDYVKLRDAQAKRYGLDTDHTSLEGKTLNACVKLLEEFDSQQVH